MRMGVSCVEASYEPLSLSLEVLHLSVVSPVYDHGPCHIKAMLFLKTTPSFCIFPDVRP